MTKVQKISSLRNTFSFTEFDYVNSHEVTFRKSELGKLKELFPFELICRHLLPNVNHRVKKGRKISRRLLHLLEKLINETTAIFTGKSISLSSQFSKRYNVIKMILQQQRLFNGEKVTERIISIDKPYLRPIVRGKEIKGVEFGAKVNAIQEGGFNFIEHLNFNAFHEGIRVSDCITLHKMLFKMKPRFFAGDAIYATNANRSYCKVNHMITNFVPKGRTGADEKAKKVIRRELNIARATVLEGSFGT